MKLVIASILLSTAFADYTSKDDVVVLTEANFKSEVLDSDDLWMVEFYAPWCGHCKSLEPNWKKAATQTLGVAKFGAVDATVHSSLGNKYGVRGYPTIKVFGKDKKKPEDYNGGRSAADLKKYAIKAATKLDPSKAENVAEDIPEPEETHGYGADVVMLNEDNFDKLIIESGKISFVKFMAPWCGHCKSMVGDLSQAATQLKGDVVVAAIDATKYGSIAGRYNVKGFPTIVVFRPDGSHEDYNGGRSTSAIVDYMTSKLEEFGVAPEVVQVTTPAVFDSACRSSGKALCVVAVLPHLIDGGAARRNKYVEVLTSLAAKNRKYSFVWTAAGEQNPLAEALGASVYPSIAAVNFKKGVFGRFTQAFDAQRLGAWLSRSLAANAKLPPGDLKIKTVDPWDGKDYVPPAEEE